MSYAFIYYLCAMTAVQLTQSMPADLEQVRAAFTENLLNVKPTSRATYSRSLKSFFTWATNTGRNIGTMTARDVNAYREYLLSRVNADGTRASALTVTTYLMAVRKFYAWTAESGIYPNVAEKVAGASRDKKFQRRPLTEDQGRGLVRYYKERGRTRDYAITLLALQTGMRTAELVNATIGGLRLAMGRIVLYFKGKHRDHDKDFVILAPETHQAIKEYLGTRENLRESDPLFTSESIRHRHRDRPEAMDTRTIRRIAGEGLRAIGLTTRDYSAHSLRHTTAVTLFKNGDSIEEVALALRHKGTNVTRGYLEMIEEEQRLAKATEIKLGKIFA